MDTAPQQPRTAASTIAKPSNRSSDDPSTRSKAARNRNLNPCAPCQDNRQGCPGGTPCARCIGKKKPEDCVPGRSKARPGNRDELVFVQSELSPGRAGSPASLLSPTDRYPRLDSPEIPTSPFGQSEYESTEGLYSEPMPPSFLLPEGPSFLPPPNYNPPTEDPFGSAIVPQRTEPSLFPIAGQNVSSSWREIPDAQLIQDGAQVNLAEYQQWFNYLQESLQASSNHSTASPYTGEDSIISQRHIFQRDDQKYPAGVLTETAEYHTDGAQNEMDSNASYGHVLNYHTLLNQGAIQSDTNAQPSYMDPSVETSDDIRWQATNQEAPQAYTYPTQTYGTYETYGSPDMFAQLTADDTNTLAFANPLMAILGSRSFELNTENSVYFTTDSNSIINGQVDSDMAIAEAQSSTPLPIESIPRSPDADITDEMMLEYLQYYLEHRSEFPDLDIPTVPAEAQN